MRTKEDRQTGPTIEWLLSKIDAFMDINHDQAIDDVSFGWYADKDRTLVPRLRLGGDVTTSKMDKIITFMQNPVTSKRSGLTLKPITIKRRAT